MNPEQAKNYLNSLLKAMLSKKASDLFLSNDFPPSMKIDGKMTPVAPQNLTPVHTRALAYAVMNDKQREEFEVEKGCNFAISPEGIGPFRVNVYTQQERVSAVFRTIPTEVPTLAGMGLPAQLGEIVMAKRRARRSASPRSRARGQSCAAGYLPRMPRAQAFRARRAPS